MSTHDLLQQAAELCKLTAGTFQTFPASYWMVLDWRERTQIVFGIEQQYRPKVDAIMLYFCEHKTLPDEAMNLDLQFLVHSRLLCAADTAHMLEETRCPLGIEHEHAYVIILNWLCLGVWEYRWDTFLKLQVLRSLSGSFYDPPGLSSDVN